MLEIKTRFLPSSTYLKKESKLEEGLSPAVPRDQRIMHTHSFSDQQNEVLRASVTNSLMTKLEGESKNQIFKEDSELERVPYVWMICSHSEWRHGCSLTLSRGKSGSLFNQEYLSCDDERVQMACETRKCHIYSPTASWENHQVKFKYEENVCNHSTRKKKRIFILKWEWGHLTRSCKPPISDFLNCPLRFQML